MSHKSLDKSWVTSQVETHWSQVASHTTHKPCLALVGHHGNMQLQIWYNFLSLSLFPVLKMSLYLTMVHYWCVVTTPIVYSSSTQPLVRLCGKHCYTWIRVLSCYATISLWSFTFTLTLPLSLKLGHLTFLWVLFCQNLGGISPRISLKGPADEQGPATWTAEELHPSSPAHVQPSDVASRACVIELFHSQVRLCFPFS